MEDMSSEEHRELSWKKSSSSQESFSSALGDTEPVWVETGTIGQGGFGKVTLWKNTMNSESLVIKEFQAPSMHSFSTDEQRFMDEARMVMKLNHRNVVRAIDLPEQTFSREIENLHLCMEYCEGGDLRNVLLKPENFCGMQESQFRSMCADIAEGIRFLHFKGITHRDLKPENILLKIEQDKTVYKLSDFGYAKEAESNRLQSMVGTLQYAAPEVLRVSQRPYRRSVDCWSFGIVVFECACGRRPFLHDDVWIETLSLVEKKKANDIYIYKTSNGKVEYSEHIPRPHQLSSILANELERWFHRVLETNPDKRDGKESLNDLKEIVNVKFLTVVNMSTGKSLGYNVKTSDPLKKLEHHIRTGMLGDESGGPSGMFLLLENGKQLTKDHSLIAACEETPNVFVFSEQQVCIRFCSNNEKPIQRIISGEIRQMPPQQKKVVRGQALCSVIKRMNQFQVLAQGLKAASQFSIKMKEDKDCLCDVEDICVEIKARCTMLRGSWELDEQKLSVLNTDQGTYYGELSQQWTKQYHMLENVLEELPVANHNANMLSEAFEVQYVETQRRLVQTIHEIARTTAAWNEPNGLINKAKELFKSLRPHHTNDVAKEEEFQSILLTIYSQCGDLTNTLSQWNVYSDLLEMLKLLSQLKRVNQNVKSNGKKILEMQEQRQEDLWSLIGDRVSNSDPEMSLHSSPETRSHTLSRSTQIDENEEHNVSPKEEQGFRRIQHSNSEPQPARSPQVIPPRQSYSTDVEVNLKQLVSIAEDSINRFDRLASVSSPAGLEELSHRFDYLLSSIKTDQDRDL